MFYNIIDPPTATVVNNSSNEALKSLQDLTEDFSKVETIPSKNSFKIGTDVEKEFLPEVMDENWIKLDKDIWSSQILKDLLTYYLFTEEYASCRKCIQKLKNIDKNVIEKVIGQVQLDAYEAATLEVTPKENKADKVRLTFVSIFE